MSLPHRSLPEPSPDSSGWSIRPPAGGSAEVLSLAPDAEGVLDRGEDVA